MRIKFIAHEDYECPIGEEWQGELKPVGHTIVAGHRIAANGVLKPFVEDITQYKTVLVDGVKTKVEVLPEEMKPDSTWLVADIKLWLDAQRIPYVGNASKTDLLALV
jgi:hypothetical protein